MTPLHVAAERGHLKIVKYLLGLTDQEVDINIQDHYRVRYDMYWWTSTADEFQSFIYKKRCCIHYYVISYFLLFESKQSLTSSFDASGTLYQLVAASEEDEYRYQEHLH